MERCDVNLPDGWVKTDLATVIVLMRNGLVALQEKGPVGIPISRIETISLGVIDFNRVRYVKNINEEKKQQYLLQLGDILFSHINSDLHLGKTAVYDSSKALLHGMNLLLIRPNQNCIIAKYLNYFLKHCRSVGKFISIAQHAVNQSSLNQRKLEKFPIRIAPLAEQKRIVDKIERLFSYLDEGERLLEQVQKQLSTYRQAVLKAAVIGELTKEWRAENRDKVESGKKLLQRVLEERRKSWQGRGKYNEPVAPDASSLPELPEGWTWTSVDSLICSGPTNGISPKISENSLGGVPSFKLSATTRGEFLITNETIKNIDLEPDKAEKYWLSSGDLLVQRGNSIEYVGTAALFPGPDRTYVYPDLMMKVRPVQSVLGQWMTFCINSRYGKNYMQKKATGTAGSMPKINGDALRYLPIPLPSLDEIEKLIQVLASLQSYCSNHEKEAQLSLRRIDHLRQSILKSAFSGELVDQNPNDEPASELLVRIQEEQKQAKAPNPRSGRTSKRSASV